MAIYDVILVDPVSQVFDQRKLPNLGLASIDSYVRQQGYRCKFIDLSEITEYIDKSDVFGISVWDHTYLTARTLTRHLQNKMVVWGGWAVMSRPEFILQENTGVDYAILQDGEHRLLKLLESRQTPDIFDTIDGIAYRNPDGEVVIRPPKTFFNLDELPVPNEDTQELPRRVDRAGTVYIELARGCYGRCAYCQHILKMRFREATKVAAEIQYWHDRGYTHFYIGNDNSLAKTKLIEELVQELETRKLRIKIMVTGRPNDVLKGLHVIEKVFKSDTLECLLLRWALNRIPNGRWICYHAV
jgi:radical SAM superfamily enzyme YgiQ (UPF0313 family)